MDRIFFVVIRRGKANAVLRKAKDCGIKKGTIFLSEGDLEHRIVDKLGLTETQKEIVMFSVPKDVCDSALEDIFLLLKKHKGIAFSIPFKPWHVTKDSQNVLSIMQEDIVSSHFCVMTIVDRGQGQFCVKTAQSAGALGATIIHGHGAGIPKNFYFPLAIEPQKDMVMIITEKENLDRIRQSIFLDLGLDEVGKGIIFTLPVCWHDNYFDTKKGKK